MLEKILRIISSPTKKTNADRGTGNQHGPGKDKVNDRYIIADWGAMSAINAKTTAQT